MPLRRSALGVCPCGDPWGDAPLSRSKAPQSPYEAPEGTDTKVTSAKGHFCARPTEAPTGMSRMGCASSRSKVGSPTHPTGGHFARARFVAIDLFVGLFCRQRGNSDSTYIPTGWHKWAATFIPMPMPETVCRTNVYDKIVQLEVCIFFVGQGYGYEYHSPWMVQGRPLGKRRHACQTSSPAGGSCVYTQSP